MAISGPKPKPPALKVIEGNPGKRPIPDAPKPPPRRPTQPRWSSLLPGDDQLQVRRDAAAEWRRVVPVLDDLGLLSTIDRSLLADYCMCWARILQCERQVGIEGLTVTEKRELTDGTIVTAQKRNQISATLKEYRSQLKFHVGELGLGPSSRGRLSVPGGADDDSDLFDA